jgi:hypothetical protein
VSYLNALLHRVPTLPAEVVLKTDLLRSGVRLETAFGSRHYHHHDESGQRADVPARAHFQGSVKLPSGSHVFVTNNPASPYRLEMSGHADTPWRLSVTGDSGDEPLCEVVAAPTFEWTSRRTSHGTPMATVFSPSLGGACGPIAAFLLRHCEFAVHGEECAFCSWVRMGRSTEMRPDSGDMRETLDAIAAEQRGIGYLAFSGGSLFNRTREADAFLAYMRAARETGVTLPPTVAAIQALDRHDSVRLKDAGFDYACYSMEVWSEHAWREVLPGKVHSVGRDQWMRCLEDAVEVFGTGRVLCNFVAGVEMATPGGPSDPVEAAEETLAGMRWCCERGIYPKYAVWIVSGGARYADRQPAPLEYYERLFVGRQALFTEFDVPVPSCDCERCLTQSCEADLARLEPDRFGLGAAAGLPWRDHHVAA